MAAVETSPALPSRAVSCGGRLPQARSAWPADAQAAYHDLLRQLVVTGRDRGAPTAHNEWIAERAVRQVWETTVPAQPSVPSAPAPDGPGFLPLELRHWPAVWRYRVADLETSGRSRNVAVGIARAEHDCQASAKTSESQQAA
jgi:hypothetical protein